MERTFSSRWVFPVVSPPIHRGCVTVEGSSIISVDPPGVRNADIDLGNVALIPGLVNAHTHLDLSGMSGTVPPSDDFVGWLLGVISHRRSCAVEQTAVDIASGLEQALAYGTTLIGDIASFGASWDQLARANVRSVVFHELLGLPSERAEAALRLGSEWVDIHKPSETTRPGISPHAPYSVRDSVFRQSVNFGVPVAIHLAESLGEKSLLEGRDGPFVPFLQTLGVWDPSGLMPSWSEIIHLPYSSTVLFVHGNYLPDHLDIPEHASVIICPRTHAAFGHQAHPFATFLNRGVRIAIGTDSLASNPDLDVLAEVRFLRRSHPEIGGDVLLRMATLSGAEALGWGDVTGSLEAGKSADIVAIPLEERDADPFDLLLSPTIQGEGIRRTMFRGAWR